MKRISAALVFVLGVAPHALAQPAGIVSKDGYWTTSDGKPLYLHASGSAPTAAALCGPACADGVTQAAPAFSAVTADPGAFLPTPWGVAAGAGGGQLTYRGVILYKFAGVLPDGQVETGLWRRAPDVETSFLQVDDPSLSWPAAESRPRTRVPEYPAASRRASESGDVAVRMCVDAKGRVLFPRVAGSSGFVRLDDATVRWAWRDLVVKPAQRNGEAVGVCGFTFVLSWQLPEPPAAAN